jgi:predicted metal-binding membrane protein
MAVLIAVGVLNVAAMVGLAAVALAEKTWRWSPAVGRLWALAVAVAMV